MTERLTQRCPTRRRSSLAVLSVFAVAVACGACLSGCGSSARSGFYERRSIEVTPVAGTGEPLGVELAADLAASSDAYASLPERR